MSRFTSHSFVVLTALLAISASGCGSKETVQSGNSPEQTTAASQQTPTAVQTAGRQSAGSGQAAPIDVVSQFLDRVRRGGADSGAQELLTQKAQQELARIGQELGPLSSPEARYEVTRAVAIPGEENAQWVHSIWTEPTEEGQVMSNQVVWTLKLEPNGWRISAFDMEIDKDTAPLNIDFEDGDRLQRTLFADSTDSTTGSTGASATNTAGNPTAGNPAATVAANPATGNQQPTQNSAAPPSGSIPANQQPETDFSAPPIPGVDVPAGNPSAGNQPASNGNFALPPSFQQ